MSAFFVTGSGTEIGKTFVTAALIRDLRRRGRHVAALKPVASGFDPEKAAASDPGILLAALGEMPTPAAFDLIAPWRFHAPLSPDMAARREDRVIDFAGLLGHSRQFIATMTGTLLIEGVGGVMVPLDDEHTILDWIEALRIPAIVVCGSYLGAISHSLTALDALRSRSLAVAALVVNETPQSTVALEETAATIMRFADRVPVIALPRLSHSDQSHPAIAHLTELLDRF
ncbi:MAG TPA: dethiobiotin synthase [Stellaceae bacterium]|jgi:dethiobiotin synthetase|nr:dethiobiotin synthase [Stellaceae bacterium]